MIKAGVWRLMIDIKDKKDCCGCGSCMQSCPSNCIQMLEDREGFRYPVVKKELCIECGSCHKSCPVSKGVLRDRARDVPAAYAAVNKDREIRNVSSSGGVFTLFSQYILEKRGIIFGAAMTEGCKRVIHVGIENEKDLGMLRGSKYVESDIGNTYKYAEKELKQGRMVLFSGTPCQIAGLKAYLKNDYDNLLLVEIICHGVPSPQLWRKHVSYIEKKLGSSSAEVNFRKKTSQFSREHGRLLLWMKAENNKVYQAFEDKDPFYCFFLRNLCLRPSCYHCHFKGENSRADITIGDFWGRERVVPDFETEGDLSLVLLHSEKGKMVFEAVKEDMKIQQTEYKAAVAYNSAYIRSVHCPEDRGQFFDDLHVFSYQKLIRQYSGRSIHVKLRSVLGKSGLLSFVRGIERKVGL